MSKTVVTEQQMAAMDFTPWEHTADEWTPPGFEEWAASASDVLPTVRTAWMSMYKTKAELEPVAQSLGDAEFEEMIKGIVHSRKFFENFVKILDAAEVRIICAAASAQSRSGSLSEA
jgi:hypothetical protein